MAKKENKVLRYLTGKVDIKATLSQLRDPAEAKLRSRGPRQIGQLKRDISVRIGKVSIDEVVKRLDAAESILTTGKVPAEAKAKDDLTKANKKIEELKKELEETKAMIPTANPVKE
jgi:hypothetical protein